MQKINRFGRIQKRLLIIATFIVFLLMLLITMMLQILKQNENLLNGFIDKDLKGLSQMVAIDSSASRISALAIELNQMGDFSGFRRKSSELKLEINNLKKINNQIQQDKINETFINNLLSSSQNILKQGNQVIEYTADAQAVLFNIDNQLQAYIYDPYFPMLSNLYNQLLALNGQNNSFALKLIKDQLSFIGRDASELTQNSLPLFHETVRLYEQRSQRQDRLVFLSLYLGTQSNETAKAANQLLDEIWKNNHEQAQNIVDNVNQKRGQLILTSVAIIVTVLFLLYVILGDLGKKIHQISGALLRLAQGGKARVKLPFYRKDEIGDLSRSYQIFENHLTELAHMSERLASQNQMMQTVFNTMRDGLSVFDAQGKLISWNDKYTQLIGIKSNYIIVDMHLSEIEEHLQKKYVKNISNRGEELDFEVTTTARLHQNLSFEKHYPNGNILELRSSPMEGGGFVTLYLDRTSRRALEQKYQQAQRLEAIGTITNGIAHDFNNFLAVIYGNVELLLEEDIKTEFKSKLNQIKRISISAQGMIERLMTFSRKESKTTIIFNANKMLGDIYQIMEPLLKEDNIILKLDLYSEPLFIKADMAEVESAILNLISNSQKAIKEEGHIILKSAYKDGNVEISVKDNGIGMDSETIKHIFEPFYSQEINDIQGTGLGLSMAYGAVKRAKGDIVASSQNQQGCLVTLILPAYSDPQEEQTQLLPDNKEKSQRIILLVDDNIEVRNILREQLQKLGHIVLEAQDGKQAINYLNKSDDINLVISDVMMPKMDGIELADYVNKWHKMVPIILFSGNKGYKIKEYNRLSPKPKIINKPWKIYEIQQLIDSLL